MRVPLKIALAGTVGAALIWAGVATYSGAATTSTSSTLVYSVANSSSLPSGVNSLRFTPEASINQSTHVIASATVPSWSASAQSAGTVTMGGDIALLDATHNQSPLVVSLFITNLGSLQSDYSFFALPVEIYSSPCTDGTCTWTPYSSAANSPLYLTSTSGFLNFNLPGGSFYDVTIEHGGSFYCTSSSTSSTASLAPSFFVSARS